MSASPLAGPHQGQPIVAAGRPIAEATAAMVMLHGRGATAENILGLARELDAPELAYLAPQAAGSTWYPYSFLAPMHANEPGLSSALARIGEVLALLAEPPLPGMSHWDGPAVAERLDASVHAVWRVI